MNIYAIAAWLVIYQHCLSISGTEKRKKMKKKVRVQSPAKRKRFNIWTVVAFSFYLNSVTESQQCLNPEGPS